MSIIIPNTIVPPYTWPTPGPAAQTLQVGSAVKDLGNNAETQMSKAHAEAVEQTKFKFDADLNQYNKDFTAASLKANNAARVIDHARKQKIKAITFLTLNILAVVGVAIASVVTGTWPIVFAATPFLIGIVPSSYYTDIFLRMNDKLEKEIEAPGLIKKPVLMLPLYNANKDLELQSSRMNAQNALSLVPLKQVAESGWSNEEIINYALLDRVTKLKKNEHPSFYAKCIQLINAYKTIGNERSRFLDQASRTYTLIDHQLSQKKRQEDASIEGQWSSIRSQERSQDRRIDRGIRHGRVPIAPIVGGIFTSISKSDLERREREVNRTYYRTEAQLKSWYQNTLTAINSVYSQVLANIEGQYVSAKSMASEV